ncbi:MAG: Homoserine dehydrogenase [Candidatus Methanosuratincola subterraneus]|uniref:homoserine dehydrogenase n=1 Tax=Methanosuratincola subterraneus TaxID=2593994 RepID=A0A3S3VBK2_METS7|nr:MAG: Homoserine dehydrogenase [Candidatus Methanosuratincola subterraneus]
MRFDIAFIGFGTVGRGFADLLLEKRELLKEIGVEWKVVAISDIKGGSVLDPNGIDLAEAVRLADSGKGIEGIGGEKKGLGALETIRESGANFVVEVTWTNIRDGEPGYSHIRAALEMGKHVATTNKGPIALHYRELMRISAERGGRLRFEGTVLSGTPVFNLFDGPLSASRVTSIRGIVNGTTNLILSEMEKGRGYADVLKEAQRMGYAEADPTMDVEGWDAAAKAAILANHFFGADIKPENVVRKGISGLTLEEVTGAIRKGGRIKLLARAWRDERGEARAEVSPTWLPASDPLASIGGVSNALTFSTDTLGEVTIVGPGAGRRATGYALMADMISIARSLA